MFKACRDGTQLDDQGVLPVMIFIFYQMKDTISYLCSMRWLNLFKSFDKIDDDEEEEEEEDKDMNINNIEMTMEGISNNDGDDTIRV